MDREKRKEQWSDLCRGTRKLAGDLGQAAWEGARRAGRAAGGAAEAARLGLEILELRGALHRQMRAVGELVYATHAGSPTPSDTLQAALEKADGLHGRLEERRRARAALKGDWVCECGAENAGDIPRCRRCGQSRRG